MPPRTLRRRAAAMSSDDDEPSTQASVADPSEDSKDEPVKRAKRGAGKRKSVKKKDVKPAPATSSTLHESSRKSPAKIKGPASRVKAVPRDVVKPGSKPIYSFFNAATHRQQSSQPSSSPEKKPRTRRDDELEAIDSEDDKSSSLQISRRSSTVLAMRKRKVQHGAKFDEETNLPPPATQKFRKTNDGSRAPSFAAPIVTDTTPWTERFAPVDLTELAVHKRKVGDVRAWLEAALLGRWPKVLVLKGAAGTGKTTTLQLLARDMGLGVVEWKNPDEVAAEGSSSVSAQFEEFVSRAGRSGGLQLSATANADNLSASAILQPKDHGEQPDKKQILLVEEFPTSLSRTSSSLQSFRSAILEYVSAPAVSQPKSPAPIVMVISETLLSTNTAAADSFTVHRLLGPELSNHSYINIIEFNPIATTYLTKALEIMVVKEARKSGRRRTPGPEVLKRLAETGDIRSAASSLEFMCLRGEESGDTWSSKVALTKPKKKSNPAMTKGEEEVLRLITNRESSLGIFHAVGRVCYNNRIDPDPSRTVPHPPSWLPQSLRRPRISERDTDELINELGTDVSTFVAGLHENYALSCHASSPEATLNSLCGSIESLSDADLLSIDRFSYGQHAFSGSATESLRQDEIAFQVGARGLLFNLPTPVHRSMSGESKRGEAHKMYYPASLKMWRKRQEVESVLEVLMTDTQGGRLGHPSTERRRKATKDAEGKIGAVETWARKNAFSMQAPEKPATAGDGHSEPAQHITVMKTELLLERLPYTARILHSQQACSPPSFALERILSVTQIAGEAAAHGGEEEDEDVAEDRVVDDLTESVDAKKKKGPHTGKIKIAKKEFEDSSGRLRLPVETSLESLVLQEDDIED